VKHVYAAAVVLAVICCSTLGASAACFGTPGFQTCNDNYGNSYTINRMGSMTQMYGNNPYTAAIGPKPALDISACADSTSYSRTPSTFLIPGTDHPLNDQSTVFSAGTLPFADTYVAFGGAQKLPR
jgi:hypothetical protein